MAFLFIWRINCVYNKYDLTGAKYRDKSEEKKPHAVFVEPTTADATKFAQFDQVFNTHIYTYVNIWVSCSNTFRVIRPNVEG